MCSRKISRSTSAVPHTASMFSDEPYVMTADFDQGRHQELRASILPLENACILSTAIGYSHVRQQALDRMQIPWLRSCWIVVVHADNVHSTPAGDKKRDCCKRTRKGPALWPTTADSQDGFCAWYLEILQAFGSVVKLHRKDNWTERTGCV
jgi:hypothetical protein